MRWFRLPFGPKARRRRVLAAAREWQEAERRAAVQRILTAATDRLPVVQPRRAPLLTRGQAARTRRS